jgi:S-(hydroxymethyl)glutathione dehydrogenase / alcohol dehydrogenase
MKTTAAVLVELDRPLELADLDIPALKPGQALVELAYSGVCHTQLLEARGLRGDDRFLPHCLGHEGSGIVREVGQGVSKVKAGDRVILSWIKGSGADVTSTTYGWRNLRVNAGAVTTFGRHAVVSENRVTPMATEVPLDQAALLGCAVPTGLGAVFHKARPSPGQSIAIFGAGGIGLCAIAGAALAGCKPVIAIDVRPDKLALAQSLGASHAIDAAQQDPVAEVFRLCPGGIDFAIEATGRPSVMRQALACVRNQGGVAVVVGNAPYGETLELDPRQFNLGKSLLGTWGGDSSPDRDYPRYAELLVSGKLRLEPLVSRRYGLSEVNRALEDLGRGEAARPLIDLTRE